MIAVLNAVASIMDAYLDAQVAVVGAVAAKGAKVLEATTAAVDEINEAVKASNLGATMQRAKQIQAEYMAAAAPHIEAVTAAAEPFEASVKRLQKTWAGATGEADKAAPRDDESDAESDVDESVAA